MSKPTLTIKVIDGGLVPLVQIVILTAKRERVTFEMSPDTALEVARRITTAATDAKDELVSFLKKH